MPLYSQNPVFFQSLDQAVLASGCDNKTRRGLIHALMMIAVDRIFRSENGVEHGSRRQLDAVCGPAARHRRFAQMLFMKQKGEEKYKVLDDNFGTEQYAVGFRKSDTALCEAVNKVLKQFQNDGTYSSIYAKWFSEN